MLLFKGAAFAAVAGERYGIFLKHLK